MTKPKKLTYGSPCVGCEFAVEVDKRVGQFEEGKRTEQYQDEKNVVQQLNHVAAHCPQGPCALAGFMAVEDYFQIRAARESAEAAAKSAAQAVSQTYTYHSPSA